MNFFTIHRTESKNASYWRNVQSMRDRYEGKMHLYLKSVLNKQYKNLDIRPDNYSDPNLTNQITEEPIEKAFRYLYMSVGMDFASGVFRGVKGHKTGMMFKAEDDPIDEWMDQLQWYIKNKAGKRITSITKESRRQAVKIIQDTLDETIAEGLGADQTARIIRKTLIEQGIQLNQWRALRIARTEVMTASNQGSFIGAQSAGAEFKYWIATHDQRVRDTHLEVEQQNPKRIDEAFIVGGIPAECPGDPDLPAEEVINCRCAIAFGMEGF